MDDGKNENGKNNMAASSSSSAGPVFNSEKASELKEEGNVAFRAGELEKAIDCYSDAISLTSLQDKRFLAVCHANIAACYSGRNELESVVEECTKAIDLDETYVKAYTRRLNAFEKMERWHEAAEDCKHLGGQLLPALKH